MIEGIKVAPNRVYAKGSFTGNEVCRDISPPGPPKASWPAPDNFGFRNKIMILFCLSIILLVFRAQCPSLEAKCSGIQARVTYFDAGAQPAANRLTVSTARQRGS